MQKKYLYIHGLNSDINSRSEQDLAKLLFAVQGLGYNYAQDAEFCYAQLCAQIEEQLNLALKHNIHLKLLGSSLGGFWALTMAKKYSLPCIAFNPVTYPHEQLRPIVGINQNIYTLEKYDLTTKILNSYEKFILNSNLPIKPFLILGQNDELLPYEVALKFWQDKAYCILTNDIHSIMNYSNYLSLMKLI